VLSLILHTVGALIVVLDPEGRILRFNRASEQTAGYSFEEVAAKPSRPRAITVPVRNISGLRSIANQHVRDCLGRAARKRSSFGVNSQITQVMCRANELCQ